MKAFVFHTAIPFGYLIAGIGFLTLAIVAGVLLFRGVLTNPRSPMLITTGGVLMFFLVLIGVANLNEEAIDENPLVRNTSELAGTWRDGASILILLPDGQYKCSGSACGELDVKGRWQRSGDFYISFQPVASQVERRLVMHAGRLKLAAGMTNGDPDMWQSRLTFERIASSS